MALISDPDIFKVLTAEVEWDMYKQEFKVSGDWFKKHLEGPFFSDTDATDMIKKKPLLIDEVVQLFGLDMHQGDLHALHNANFTATLNLTGTQIDLALGDDKVVTGLPVKAGAVKMLEEGMMPDAGKALLKSKMDAAINVCIKYLANSGKAAKESVKWSEVEALDTDPEPIKVLVSVAAAKSMVWEFVEANEKVKCIKELRILTGLSLKDAKAVVDNWFDEHDQNKMDAEDDFEVPDDLDAIFNKDKPTKTVDIETGEVCSVSDALKKEKIQLKHAEFMYQPVDGTSESSTYHCIAKAGSLRFAARYKDSNLSIRVEGPVEAHKTALITAGFNSDYISKGYTSVHFNGLQPLMAMRALGAVLTGTGLEFQTVMPSLGVIDGYGS